MLDSLLALWDLDWLIMRDGIEYRLYCGTIPRARRPRPQTTHTQTGLATRTTRGRVVSTIIVSTIIVSFPKLDSGVELDVVAWDVDADVLDGYLAVVFLTTSYDTIVV